MKPVKALLPFATWLMRLAVAFFVFVTFLHILKSFDLKSIHFYVAVVFIVFGTLLFIGGFMKKPGITVFSGLMLFFASVYKIILIFSAGLTTELAIFCIVATISLFFVTVGNKN
jgi:hypothetical protein